MNYKKILKPKNKESIQKDMQELDDNRLIEMAWQDRTSFDVIYKQYGITENQLKKRMRKLISKKAYDRWRRRVQGRSTKHLIKSGNSKQRFQGPW